MTFEEFDALATTDVLEHANTLARIRERDDESRWAAVAVLQRRPGRAVFEQAIAWCASVEPRLRALGANILAQLGAPDCPFAAESTPTLSALLSDHDEDVVVEALHALGHLRTGSTSVLTVFARHPSARLRRAVTHALGWRAEPEAIDALQRLTTDDDAEIRDWATFGLGTLSEQDSTEIRDTLVARLTDEDTDVRCEALVGLARRHDLRAINAIAAELASSDVRPLAIEAAELMPSPVFVELLRAIVRSSPTLDVYRALDRCEASGASSA